jgi:hypothetical protein
MMVPILHLVSRIGSQMIQFRQFLLEQSVARERFHDHVISLIPHYEKQLPPFTDDDVAIKHPTIPGVQLTITSNRDRENQSFAHVHYSPLVYGPFGQQEMRTNALPHVTAWALTAIKLNAERHGQSHKTYFGGSSRVHDKIYTHLIDALNKVPGFEHLHTRQTDWRGVRQSYPTFVFAKQHN